MNPIAVVIAQTYSIHTTLLKRVRKSIDNYTNNNSYSNRSCFLTVFCCCWPKATHKASTWPACLFIYLFMALSHAKSRRRRLSISVGKANKSWSSYAKRAWRERRNNIGRVWERDHIENDWSDYPSGSERAKESDLGKKESDHAKIERKRERKRKERIN